ncbi:MAG: hypothetical protein JNK78_19945 [Planctomycetes bacterium]|nr:hypothetical protein [Planctomycetota bacterium]
MVWWIAQVWLPWDWFARWGLDRTFGCCCAMAGAALGTLWFACDLPWFASRREPSAAMVRSSPPS